MNENLLQIINNYGVISQLKYFQSEVFELNEAIIKKEIEYCFSETTIKMDEYNKNHIAEEIADCYVMLEQFRRYYKISSEEMVEIMKEKIDRQLTRIASENK